MYMFLGRCYSLKEPCTKFWLAQRFLKGFIDSWSLQHQTRRKVSLEKYIFTEHLVQSLPSSNSPFCHGNQHNFVLLFLLCFVLLERLNQASSPSLMFYKVILTAEIWDPHIRLRKNLSFLCISLLRVSMERAL